MPIEKLRPGFVFDEQRIEQLKQIAPECFADGKINWETLKEALGNYTEDDDPDTEHFGLFWPGKKEARRLASTPSRGTLVPVRGEGVNEENTRNIFIEGENLEVLKLLQKSYAGRIKMIYIDPPYNTGNDFVYDDNFTESLDEYLKRTGQIDEDGKRLVTNSKADGRFHSKWLSMMYPRLRLARNLLAENGIFFISIDDNEVQHLILLMNEIFGEENKVGTFVWKRRASSNLADKNYSADHEYVICFQKGKFSQFKGYNKDFTSFKNPDNDPRGEYVLGDLTVGMTASMRPNQAYNLIDPQTGDEYPFNPNRVWSFAPDSMNKMIKEGRVYFPKDISKRPMQKRYKSDLLESTNPISSILKDVGLNTEGTKLIQEVFGGRVFEFSKPISLIKTLCYQTLNSGDIVLDFFSGSNTTGHAVYELFVEEKLDIHFITVQLPEAIDKKTEAFKAGYSKISSIAIERLKRVNSTLGINQGFRVFKLSSSNFKHWDAFQKTDTNSLELALDEMTSPLIKNWKEEDLLIEILLIEGFPINSKIKIDTTFDSNKIVLVFEDFSDYKLLICLDEKINSNTISKMKVIQNGNFICLDTAINDSQKIELSNKIIIKTI